MNARFRLIVLFAFLAEVLWCLSASWLTAHEVIKSVSEVESYLWCLCLMLFTAVCYLWLACRANIWHSFLAAIVAFSGLIIGVIASRTADDTFMFWKIRAISPATWQLMVSDLKALGNDIPQRDKSGFFPIPDPNRMPKSFDFLGLRKEFVVFEWGTQPCVRFGSKGAQGRQWGLFVGSRHFWDGEHPEVVKRIRVTDDAYFFVDPN